MSDQELENLEHTLMDGNANPIPLSFQLLQRITDDFSKKNVIGHGGFAIVYKGVLRRGKVVAVKKLSNITDETSERQFESELLYLMRVKHKNIVRILGYCCFTSAEVMSVDNGRRCLVDIPRRFLCLEYVPHKSLKEYIEDASYRRRKWDTTFGLIKGICCGLQYLHNEEDMNHLDLKPRNILLNFDMIQVQYLHNEERRNHLDFKPGNILLNYDMVPKIADFGLSRCSEGDEQSTTLTKNVIGTPGYMPPEYIENGEISFKFDIYSLGVIIRKMLRGSNDLSDFEEWRQKSPLIENPQVRRCIEISQRCLDRDQHKRPTVDDIIRSLNEVSTETVDQMVPPAFGHSSNNNSVSWQEQVNRRTSWLQVVGSLARQAYQQMYTKAYQQMYSTCSVARCRLPHRRISWLQAVGMLARQHISRCMVCFVPRWGLPHWRTSWSEAVGMLATQAYQQMYRVCLVVGLRLHCISE